MEAKTQIRIGSVAAFSVFLIGFIPALYHCFIHGLSSIHELSSKGVLSYFFYVLSPHLFFIFALVKRKDVLANICFAYLFLMYLPFSFVFMHPRGVRPSVSRYSVIALIHITTVVSLWLGLRGLKRLKAAALEPCEDTDTE